MEIERTAEGIRIYSRHLGWLKNPSAIPFEVLDRKTIATTLKVSHKSLDEGIVRLQRKIKVSIIPIQNEAEIDPAREDFTTMGINLGRIIWPKDFDLDLITHKKIIEIETSSKEPIQQTIAGVINSLSHNNVGVCMSEIDQECVEKLKPDNRAIFIARFWKNEFMHFGVLRVT